ncbi:espin-like [Momordica charantia]|uniref:Espin-like n=1 Tax=Momordica charantia TaxID=3673 RepID=A0A6J1CVT2_MOMCH|nr:espin-like [Momordica charantia]
MIGSERANLQEFVSTNLRRGNWDGVIRKYEEEPEAHGLKLPQSGDTALHLAAFDNQQQVVARLVSLISSCRNQHQVGAVIGIQNDRGNTPLHIAATVGSATMCHCIASLDPSLVDQRNNVGETPLFLAALHGNKEAFYCLYHFCASDRITPNCRRNDGDTVLHCALRNDQFDLAFHIISVNNDAANWVDMQGLTPLHVLATKPTAFRSGTIIKGWRNIVYSCDSSLQLHYPI